MISYPCAKINLGLNVVCKRDDGYHDLETVFYPVRLTDEIRIKECGTDEKCKYPCTLNIEGISIAGDLQDNLIVKAYNLLKENYAALPEISVSLKKNIPTQAGMGGGSSDGAYMIRMLNDMFSLNISVNDMRQLASKLGADCPFFINPIPSYAEGKGEKLVPVTVDLSRYFLAIVKPPLSISTKEAFLMITPHRPMKNCRDIVMQPIETWKDELVNDFEQSVGKVHPEIADIKHKLYDMGALYAAMSGSGSALFGIFKDKPKNLSFLFDKCFTAVV